MAKKGRATNKKSELLQGTLDMLILKTLTAGKCMGTRLLDGFSR